MLLILASQDVFVDAIKMVKSSNDPSKTYYQFLQEFIVSEGMKDVTVEDLGKIFSTLTPNQDPFNFVYHELIWTLSVRSCEDLFQ